MPFLLCIMLLTFGSGTGAKSKSFAVPKYSPSYNKTSRDVGPLPGTRATDHPESEFKRIYSHPAGLRLLVRANCDTPIGRGDLITKARQLTTAAGPVVQIDWEPINGDRVTYWVVASAQRKVATHDLSVVEGKYVASNPKVTTQEHWRVQRLAFGNQKCPLIKEIDSKKLRQEIFNFLNLFTVDFFRSPSTQLSSSD